MSNFGWGLVLLGIYVLLVILARWVYIARPNVVWTNAQASAVIKRLSISRRSKGDPSATGNAPVTQPTLQSLIEDIKKHSPTSDRSGIIGWNGSHQIAQWVLMHEAERLALPDLDHAHLVARLERARGSWVSCLSRGGRPGRT